MREKHAYIGEDIAILGQVGFNGDETPVSLDQFEITVNISTTALGPDLTASTHQDADHKVIVREENIFGVNIPSSFSSGMSPGQLIISLALTHKETGARIIGETKGFYLQESQIAKKI